MHNNFPNIGVIFCSYGMPEYIEDSLKPWLKLREKYGILIAAVNGMFKEYAENGAIDNDLETQEKLKQLRNNHKLDYLYIQNPKIDGYQTEAQIRNKALQYLKYQSLSSVDFYIIVDLDEFYTEEQIESIIKFIGNPYFENVGYFNIPFKNYTFSEKQWIDGFCPFRVFRNKIGDFRIQQFFYDNDIQYVNDKTGEIKKHTEFPGLRIPKNILNSGIKHITWLNNEKSKNKVLYHQNHFSHGAGCAFKWDNEKGLIFNEEYYKLTNQSIPIVYED